MSNRVSRAIRLLSGFSMQVAVCGCGQKANYQRECDLLKPQIEERSAYLQTVQDQIARADQTVWGNSSPQAVKNMISGLEGKVATIEKELEPIRAKEAEARKRAADLAKELADYRAAYLDNKH